MKNVWYITIFYSHIESYKHLNRNHMKDRKGKVLYRHSIGCSSTLISPVWNRVCSNPDAVPATQHKSVLSDILYLVPLFSLGSIRTMFLIYLSKFFRGKRFASSLGIKESKALGFLEPAAASVSKEHCAYFVLLVKKALWHLSNLWFFCVLSLIIHCQLEYLQEATMECISKAVIL